MRRLTIEEKTPVIAEHFLRDALGDLYERFFRYSMEAGHTWDELVEEVVERAMPLRYASGRPRPDWRDRLLRAVRAVALEMKQRYPMSPPSPNISCSPGRSTGKVPPHTRG